LELSFLSNINPSEILCKILLQYFAILFVFFSSKCQSAKGVEEIRGWTEKKKNKVMLLLEC
jgi:hypothetical protein